MANVKINDLAAAAAVTNSMQFETDTGGITAEKVTAAQLKTYANAFDGARLVRAASFDVANGNIVFIAWDTEAQDTDNYWSSANSSRLTATKTGLYSFTISARSSTNHSGVYELAVRKNGNESTYVWSDLRTNSTSTLISFGITGRVYLTAGDYIEFGVYNLTGATVTISPSFLAPQLFFSFEGA